MFIACWYVSYAVSAITYMQKTLRPSISHIWAVLQIRKVLAYSHLSLSTLKCLIYLIYFMIRVLHVFLFHMIFISNLCSFYLCIDWLMFNTIQKDTSVANESCRMAASILYNNITRGCGSCIKYLKPYWLIDTADKVFASRAMPDCFLMSQNMSVSVRHCKFILIIRIMPANDLFKFSSIIRLLCPV